MTSSADQGGHGGPPSKKPAALTRLARRHPHAQAFLRHPSPAKRRQHPPDSGASRPHQGGDYHDLQACGQGASPSAGRRARPAGIAPSPHALPDAKWNFQGLEVRGGRSSKVWKFMRAESPKFGNPRAAPQRRTTRHGRFRTRTPGVAPRAIMWLPVGELHPDAARRGAAYSRARTRSLSSSSVPQDCAQGHDVAPRWGASATQRSG